MTLKKQKQKQKMNISVPETAGPVSYHHVSIEFRLRIWVRPEGGVRELIDPDVRTRSGRKNKNLIMKHKVII